LSEDEAMHIDLGSLVDRYDNGEISRRALIGTLAALLIPRSTVESPEPRIAQAKQLNHVTLYVKSVDDSRAFYQELFGMPALTRIPPGLNLRAGSSFLGLYPAAEAARVEINHFCLGIEHFEAEAVKKKLAAQGLDASINQRGDTKELYFFDPNGIRVQVQDVRYRGGVGPLGDRNP
jgi:catechol 2,3-dioxygenase-like lactoylglutathione lyase family enzyme